MRRLALLLALAPLGALAWAVAPALSLSLYTPAPVDFEQPLPAVAAKAGGLFVSPVIRAPHRFDAVGLAKRHEPVAYRVRRIGGRWSPWTEVDSGDPVWAGGADEVQLRSDHGRPHGRLHYVNVSGTAGGGRRLLNAVRQAVNNAVISLLPGSARAARARSTQGPPPIVGRAQWGADESCRPRAPAAYGEVQAAVVHHTVSANDYSAEAAPGIVLAICRFHRNGNDWNDIGYNALVDRFGVLYEGRAGGLEQAVVGAQAQGYNSQTTGIASIGTHTSAPLSEPAMRATASFLGWKLGVHGVPATGQVTLISQGGKANRYRAGTPVTLERIFGHRDVDSTACPGGAFYGQLAQLRSMVQAPSLPIPLVSLEVEPPVLDYPQGASLAGRLVGSDTGQPLGGAPVTIQILGKTGWRAYARLVTDNDGSFQASVSVAGSRQFRARAPAYGAYRPALSPTRAVAVRPEMRVRFSYLSRFQAGRRAIVRGTVRPAKQSLVLVVMRQRKNGTFGRFGRLPVRAAGGRYSVAYRFRRPGRYVFRVVFKGDRSNSRARAADLPARVLPNPGLGTGGEAPPAT